jgi:hypothetical protein
MSNTLWLPVPVDPDKPEADEYGVGDYRVEDGEGGVRVTGCSPRDDAPGDRLPLFEARDEVQILGSNSWVSQDYMAMRAASEARDLDQNGYPACTNYAGGCATESLCKLDRRPPIKVDCLRVWKDITGGRGGTNLYDHIDYAMQKGYPLEGSTDRVYVAEAWDCSTLEGLATGLLLGCMAIFGHDSHCECAKSLVFQSRKWFLDTRNSWGRDWGDNGWHLFPLDAVEIKRYGAVLFREVRVYPKVPDLVNAT